MFYDDDDDDDDDDDNDDDNLFSFITQYTLAVKMGSRWKTGAKTLK